MNDTREQELLGRIEYIMNELRKRNKTIKLLKLENYTHMNDKVRLQEDILRRDIMDHYATLQAQDDEALLEW